MSTAVIVLIILSVLGHIYFSRKKKTSNDDEAMATCRRHPILCTIGWLFLVVVNGVVAVTIGRIPGIL